MELVLNEATAATATSGVVDLHLRQEVALRSGDVAQAAVAVALDASTSGAHTIPRAGDVAASNSVVHTNEQVAAIVGVRRGEVHHHLAIGNAQGTRVNHSAWACKGTNRGIGHLGHEDLEVGVAPAYV